MGLWGCLAERRTIHPVEFVEQPGPWLNPLEQQSGDSTECGSCGFFKLGPCTLDVGLLHAFAKRAVFRGCGCECSGSQLEQRLHHASACVSAQVLILLSEDRSIEAGNRQPPRISQDIGPSRYKLETAFRLQFTILGATKSQPGNDRYVGVLGHSSCKASGCGQRTCFC